MNEPRFDRKPRVPDQTDESEDKDDEPEDCRARKNGKGTYGRGRT